MEEDERTEIEVVGGMEGLEDREEEMERTEDEAEYESTLLPPCKVYIRRRSDSQSSGGKDSSKRIRKAPNRYASENY